VTEKVIGDEAHVLGGYRGTDSALNDLIGGHADCFCEQAISVAPQIAAGTIKAYGVSVEGSQRQLLDESI
jgi:tripartite-type tricarboxylate transporter receptor subunit TctC